MKERYNTYTAATAIDPNTSDRVKYMIQEWNKVDPEDILIEAATLAKCAHEIYDNFVKERNIDKK